MTYALPEPCRNNFTQAWEHPEAWTYNRDDALSLILKAWSQ